MRGYDGLSIHTLSVPYRFACYRLTSTSLLVQSLPSELVRDPYSMASASGSIGNLSQHVVGDEQKRQNLMIGVSIAMTMVSLACVGLRVYTRAFIVRNMGAEDWTIVAAAVSSLQPRP